MALAVDRNSEPERVELSQKAEFRWRNTMASVLLSQLSMLNKNNKYHIHWDRFRSLIGLWIWLVCGSLAPAATLAWDANPEPNVAGYLVHYGTASGVYTATVDARNATTATIPDPPAGVTYFAVVTAYDKFSIQSPPSNEVLFSTSNGDAESDPANWRIAGTGDFDGNGKTDTLWQNLKTGRCAIALMDGINWQSWVDLGVIPLDWRIVGTGDFSGDGKVDILWRNDFGEVVIWIMDGTAYRGVWEYIGPVDPRWQIVGTGDFSGDGKVDILWRSNFGEVVIWIMDGTRYTGGWEYIGPVSLDWQIVGTGDFSGNGRTDILWRRFDGDFVIWLMNGTRYGTAEFLGLVSPVWQVVATGDFSGDGKPDIIWRSSQDNLLIWRMAGTAYNGSWSLMGPVSGAWGAAAGK
jgi:hypothetical protein